MTAGRPTKYKKEYAEILLKYFKKEPVKDETIERVTKDGKKVKIKQKTAVDFPTIAGFCASIGIHKDTLHEWIKKFPEFSDAYNTAKNYQENILVVNALKSFYNPAFSAFFAKNNLGYADKQEAQNTNFNFNADVKTDYDSLMALISNYSK